MPCQGVLLMLPLALMAMSGVPWCKYWLMGEALITLSKHELPNFWICLLSLHLLLDSGWQWSASSLWWGGTTSPFVDPGVWSCARLICSFATWGRYRFGVSWLSSLGSILQDYSRRLFECSLKGQKYSWIGGPSGKAEPVQLHTLEWQTETEVLSSYFCLRLVTRESPGPPPYPPDMDSFWLHMKMCFANHKVYLQHAS